jgi:phage shock protein A
MPRNPLTQLATLGEDVLEKASQNPAAARLVQSATQARDRLDDLTKRVRGLESMENRIVELEERVKKLENNKKPAAARKAAASSSSKGESSASKAE